MAAQDTSEIYERIISFINENGPSLPVQIARRIQNSMLFTSAFLSELVASKKLKMTEMRVGSSPVYYTEGQEQRLEEYSKYLKGKEKESYELLKQYRFLVDEQLPPPIRVAIRGIKDFAKPMEGKDIWRYYLENDANYVEQNQPVMIKEEVKITELEPVKEIEQPKIEINVEEIKEKTVTEYKKVTEEKDFIKKIKLILEIKKIKVLEEIEVKKKEFFGIGRIETNLGEIEILIIGKDKKTIADADLEKIYEKVVETKKTAIFLCTGEIAKKTKETYRNYKNTIFFEKI